MAYVARSVASACHSSQVTLPFCLPLLSGHPASSVCPSSQVALLLPACEGFGQPTCCSFRYVASACHSSLSGPPRQHKAAPSQVTHVASACHSSLSGPPAAAAVRLPSGREPA